VNFLLFFLPLNSSSRSPEREGKKKRTRAVSPLLNRYKPGEEEGEKKGEERGKKFKST